LKLRVKCGSGTYVRSLADDIGRELGTGGYCLELRRTKVGDFDVKAAITLPLDETAVSAALLKL
jgi:tRNA pseudouridine55 synthase